MSLVLAAILAGCTASSGDRLTEFKTCVEGCSSQCPRDLGLLPLLLWTCEADCDYVCQQFVTAQHLRTGAPLHQYHGKWPFIRVLGVQEPASVIFSLLNLVANLAGRTHLTGKTGPMAPFYQLFSLISMNTWVWSSVFHIRDFVLTERLDYFSAIASILYGLFLAVVRLGKLYDYPLRLKLVATGLLAFYLYHVLYLSLVHFDYGYNMLVGVVAGIIQNVLWIAIGVGCYRKSHQLVDLLPVAIILGVMGGMSFELFDFSPFWLTFDAHSLWHAATILPTYGWYIWMAFDLDRDKPKYD